jgi:hypothetical protein
MSGMETPPRPAQTINIDSLENPRTPLAAELNKAGRLESNIQEGFTLPPDAPSSLQDAGGMMKIVPSELDVSALLYYYSTGCAKLNQIIKDYVLLFRSTAYCCLRFTSPSSLVGPCFN